MVKKYEHQDHTKMIRLLTSTYLPILVTAALIVLELRWGAFDAPPPSPGKPKKAQSE